MYRVKYSGTRKFDTYKTQAAAFDQARYATKAGNMRPCVQKRMPSGRWRTIKCFRRR